MRVKLVLLIFNLNKETKENNKMIDKSNFIYYFIIKHPNFTINL